MRSLFSSLFTRSLILQSFRAELIPKCLNLLQEDSKRISTLEWLLLSPDARLDAFVQANALMRYFIGSFVFFFNP